ncbi:single-stranded DNA-binding protein [Candidatus Roizmanbacteria bacterium CG10_big_fil_rev_8_21_14_0_10_39_6]|uniref:Single-stranded DNA-binding protein n=1 Tax=Candidatus Roizmanbacteria bacterium CG10_big_fil_rev_8_21_14_0_10_39_6 TaxID=1974853 RepID=A0A2M8KRD2_9BACT|nr:MAG: single-stranded DNA-binding protein [Candidatus Roizmanbacteria bacterium CG10_big_fil_rev_8_21_14_0_10_39_6]
MSSRSLNKVALIGNLTRDPELRYTPQGTAVAQFGLATNRDWVTANGEKKEEVQYHRIIAWSKLAELCSQLLSKGSKVFVEGRIVYRQFEGKDGTQKNITEIVMDNMIVLTPKSPTGQSTASDEDKPEEKKSKDALKGKKADDSAQVEENKTNEDIDDEEIPF